MGERDVGLVGWGRPSFPPPPSPAPARWAACVESLPGPFEVIMTASAIDRFFYDYDDNGYNRSLDNARAYITDRLFDTIEDVEGVQECMLFTPWSKDVLRCQIYGHTILLSTGDNALHSGQKAGGGDFYLRGRDAGDDPEIFDHLDQVIAYILAVNW